MSTILKRATILKTDTDQRKHTLPASPKFTGILRIEHDLESEEKELTFELAYQRTLTIQQRFELMFRKSREMMEVMLRHGYRKPFEIIKRT